MGDQWYWEAMPAEDHIRMVSDPGFLGDPLVRTQHLLGATQWEQLSETEVNGTWKSAGLRPTVRWNGYDFEHIFKGIKFEDFALKNDKKEEVEKPSTCATENGENEINGVKKEMCDANEVNSTSNGKYLDFVV